MPVKLGLEVLLESRLELLRGQRVGIIVNPSSIDTGLQHLLDRLWEHPEVDLRAVFGPQHGARGETQDNMIEWQDYQDPVTGLPVFSLYAETRKPTPAMLSEVDVLLFDVQDVGTRIYTFIYTMALAMQACREAGKRFVVLDRPNPINGVELEGPVLSPDFASFVGLYPLPIRHAMTVAEIARYFNEEMGVGAELETVPMEGWRREMYFDDTGLPWVFPSPNIPTLESAVVFPGMVLFEGTNISEGRGSTRPFELSGAPWIDPQRLAGELNQLSLEGVQFRPVHWQPTFHKWHGQTIGGVQIHVTDRARYRPVRTALEMLLAYRSQSPRFQWNDPPYEYEFEKLPFDVLCGTDRIRRSLETGATVSQMEADWRVDLEAFGSVRERYLLY